MDEFINSNTSIVETSDDDLLYKIESLKNFYQRDHVVAVLKQFGPYRFFGTLSFQYKLSYWQAKEFASVHARDVMKILFGKKVAAKNRRNPQ